MCSLLVNPKPFPDKAVRVCWASVSFVNKNHPNYHVTLLVLSEQIKIYRTHCAAETAHCALLSEYWEKWSLVPVLRAERQSWHCPRRSSLAFLYMGTIWKGTVASVCHVWAWGIPHGLPGTLWEAGLPPGCAEHAVPDLWHPQTPNSNRHWCSGNRLEPPRLVSQVMPQPSPLLWLGLCWLHLSCEVL